MGRDFEPGALIDVNRLYWFIRVQRLSHDRVYGAYEMGYLDAVAALEKWLSDGGYETPPSTDIGAERTT